jgi:NAD kinase
LESDTKDIDLVVALGGDHTYLRASAMATNQSVPLLGIDTNEAFAHGHLGGNVINFKHKKEIAENLLKCLD